MLKSIFIFHELGLHPMYDTQLGVKDLDMIKSGNWIKINDDHWKHMNPNRIGVGNMDAEIFRNTIGKGTIVKYMWYVYPDVFTYKDTAKGNCATLYEAKTCAVRKLTMSGVTNTINRN